jgi:hypothetical protein
MIATAATTTSTRATAVMAKRHPRAIVAPEPGPWLAACVGMVVDMADVNGLSVVPRTKRYTGQTHTFEHTHEDTCTWNILAQYKGFCISAQGITYPSTI